MTAKNIEKMLISRVREIIEVMALLNSEGNTGWLSSNEEPDLYFMNPVEWRDRLLTVPKDEVVHFHLSIEDKSHYCQK